MAYRRLGANALSNDPLPRFLHSTKYSIQYKIIETRNLKLAREKTIQHGFEIQTKPAGRTAVTRNHLSFRFFKLPKLEILIF